MERRAFSPRQLNSLFQFLSASVEGYSFMLKAHLTKAAARSWGGASVLGVVCKFSYLLTYLTSQAAGLRSR